MFANVVPSLCPLFSVESDKTVQLATAGQPTPKARGRVVRCDTGVRIYNSSHAKEAAFAAKLKALMGGLLPHNNTFYGSEYLVVSIVFAYPRPLSHYHGGKRTAEALKEGMPRFPRHADLDNLAKFVLDALNGILFDDDSQVVFLYTRKLWVPNHEAIGSTTVRISFVDI